MRVAEQLDHKRCRRRKQGSEGPSSIIGGALAGYENVRETHGIYKARWNVWYRPTLLEIVKKRKVRCSLDMW